MPDTQMVRVAREAFKKCRPVDRVVCQDFGMQQDDILDQQLEAALEAALSGHVVGWRTMDSAPKDGTAVLVWFRGAIHVAEYVAVWAPENKHWCVRDPATDMEPTSNTVRQIEPPTLEGKPYPGMWLGPTHWQPLPAPPVPEMEG